MQIVCLKELQEIFGDMDEQLYNSATWDVVHRCWGYGSLVKRICCHYIMVEADSHLKLLPASKIYMYNVYKHIDMHGHPHQTYTMCMSELICCSWA
jgi:hypothetical protein